MHDDNFPPLGWGGSASVQEEGDRQGGWGEIAEEVF